MVTGGLLATASLAGEGADGSVVAVEDVETGVVNPGSKQILHGRNRVAASDSVYEVSNRRRGQSVR